MSDAVTVALIAALAPSLLVAVTWWLNNQKLKHITTLTNSTLTDSKAEVARLEGVIRELVQERDKGKP